MPQGKCLLFFSETHLLYFLLADSSGKFSHVCLCDYHFHCWPVPTETVSITLTLVAGTYLEPFFCALCLHTSPHFSPPSSELLFHGDMSYRQTPLQVPACGRYTCPMSEQSPSGGSSYRGSPFCKSREPTRMAGSPLVHLLQRPPLPYLLSCQGPLSRLSLGTAD